ncbi:uncharacterized protein TNCV_2154681 [Trichonephila clavipes]|nr:uncharacterized protein TNCV_2154681 [Trichonephila clavipes]
MQMASLLSGFLSPSSRPFLRLPSMASAPFNVVVEGASTDNQAPKTLGILLAVLTIPLCLLKHGDLRVYFELDEKIDKSETPSAQISTIVYDPVERRYLSNLWTHVYTDGTMIELGAGVGAEVYCNHFAFYKTTVRDTTNFEGEVEVIFIALNQLSPWRSFFPRADILPDRTAIKPPTIEFALPNKSLNVEKFSTP